MNKIIGDKMKNQKVTIIVNDIESNGIISLKNNVIYIDMGITNQIIDFRDISAYDKKRNFTLGLILKNNKSIDLVFKDYLLLYKIIDDYTKKQLLIENSKGIKCPECKCINENDNMECSNCGFPLRKRRKNISVKAIFNNKLVFIIIIVLLIVSIIGIYFNKYKVNNSINNDNDGTITSNNNNNNNNNAKGTKKIDYDQTINNRNKSITVFSGINGISDYILVGYNNSNYRCINVIPSVGSGECYEIDYTKNGENVVISYVVDSDYVSFDCKETKTKLVCYMDDGITVYAEYTREK